MKKPKQKPVLDERTFEKEGAEMAEIIRANAERLRTGCPVNPWADPETAGAYYSGVAMGIGIALQWRNAR